MNALVSYGRVIRAGMKKNWILSVTYPTYMLNRILGPIVGVSITLYSYLALTDASSIRDALTRSGNSGNFVGFLILGQTIYSLFSTLNMRGGLAISRERWQGTLEIVLQAPTSRVAFILGETIYGLLDGGWTVLLALLVTGYAYAAGFHVAHPGLALAVMALTLSSMIALSLFFASFYVLTRSAAPLSNAILAPVRFFTGTSWPVSVLPSLLQVISFALPMTYGMIATREVFLGGGTWAGLAPTLLALGAFTVFFWVAGVILVRRMEDLAKLRGTLHTY